MRCLPWRHRWALVEGSRHLWPIGSDHMSGIFPMGWHVLDQCERCTAWRPRPLEPQTFVQWSRGDEWDEAKKMRRRLLRRKRG